MTGDLSPCKDPIHSGTPRNPVLERTTSTPPMSSPSLSRTSRVDYLQQPSSLKIVTQITPPTSPTPVRSNTDFEDSTSPRPGRKSSVTSSQTRRSTFVDDNVVGEDIPLIIECPFEVEIARNHSDRPQLFGQGAWSKVYRATGRQKMTLSSPSAIGVFTPPPSPQTAVPLLVAVKSPLSDASRTILRNEAVTLSHLSRTPYHEHFIVPFYGYVPSSASLVLAPVPLPLSDHITACARLAGANQSDLTSTEPALGSSPSWLGLADKLITALSWLHDQAGVVHGDVKPANILLSPNRSSDDFAFDPLLIDFSSSDILSAAIPTSNTLSALTREYTAPELLSPSVLRDPTSTAKPSSDVFSLAVTLIVAATGDLMVYHGNVWQRQHMAQQGFHILEFVRNGEGGMRLPRGGVVERVVRAAVRKTDEGRIDALRWRALVRAIRRDEEGTTQMRKGQEGV